MTTSTLTITDFLLARIAEDEELLEREDRVYGGGGEVWTREAHARVLAECEAKRRIVELHSNGGADTFSRGFGEDITHTRRPACLECGAWGEFPVAWPCPTLRALAAVYADHEDFREEWRP